MAIEVFCPQCGGVLAGPADAGRPCTCGAAQAEASSSSAKKICCVCGIDVTNRKRMKDSRGYWCWDCGTSDSKRQREQDTVDLDEDGEEQTSGPAKVCCVCGADVTRRKRMKDSSGKYWCYACGKADKQAKRHATDGTGAPAEGGSRGEIEVTCPDCGKLGDPSVMRSFDGILLCERCHYDRTLLAKETERRLGRAGSQGTEHKSRRLQMLMAVFVGLLLLVMWRFGIFATDSGAGPDAVGGGATGSGTDASDLVAGARVILLVFLTLILGFIWWIKRQI